MKLSIKNEYIGVDINGRDIVIGFNTNKNVWILKLKSNGNVLGEHEDIGILKKFFGVSKFGPKKELVPA